MKPAAHFLCFLPQIDLSEGMELIFPGKRAALCILRRAAESKRLYCLDSVCRCQIKSIGNKTKCPTPGHRAAVFHRAAGRAGGFLSSSTFTWTSGDTAETTTDALPATIFGVWLTFSLKNES